MLTVDLDKVNLKEEVDAGNMPFWCRLCSQSDQYPNPITVPIGRRTYKTGPAILEAMICRECADWLWENMEWRRNSGHWTHPNNPEAKYALRFPWVIPALESME